MRKIDINECHKLLLGIAKEFDRICTKHNIPYYMLGGTMLGAIRHKGFIPWDDDMDFGVPRPHYQKLIEVLEKDLPKSYRCCTFENHEAVKSPFIKIADCNTLIDDPRTRMSLEKQIGLNIDIFPLDCCDKDDKNVKRIHRWLDLSQIIYIESTRGNKLKTIVKFLLRLIFPIRYNAMMRKINVWAASLPKGKCWGNLFGRWRVKEIIPLEWYGEGVRYEYEDTTFCGIKNYDDYLTHMYGEYMQLPSVEKRDCHADNVYIK